MTELPWWILIPAATVLWWFALAIIVNIALRLLDLPVVGDRVTVSGTVKELSELSGEVRAVLDGGYYTVPITQKELAHAEITRPPRPLAVGDTIRLSGWDEEFRVVSLEEDGPWVVPSHRPSAVPVKVPRRGVRR